MAIDKIMLIAEQLSAEGIKRMKVRNDSKTKTALAVLAKASPVYEYGKVQGVTKNDGFNNFGEVFDRNMGWVATQRLQPVKQLQKMNTRCFLNADIADDVNGLLRNILLFRGIGFDEINNELKLTGEPVTYNVNTKVQLMKVDENGLRYTDEFRVFDIVVKKAFVDTTRTIGKLVTKGGSKTRTKTTIEYDKKYKMHTRKMQIIEGDAPELDLDSLWSVDTSKRLFFDSKTCKKVRTMLTASNEDVNF